MGGTCSVTGDVKGKANEFFKAGKYCEAVEAYTFALDADPKDHTVYSNRSAARMKLQQHGFAITDALSCIALAPTWPKGYYRLGSALAAAKKYGEAADNLRRALALSPDDAAIRAALEDVEKAAAKLGGAGRGYVYTWGAAEAVGRGSDGAEGGGARGASASSTPKMLEGAMGRQVVDVACGLQHTVLVTVGGEVMSWGSNKYGQCGCDRKTELVTRPKYVSGLFGHRCVSVACGGAHTFVITDIGKTFSWGQGACGQLGQGHTNTVVATPSQVAALADKQVRGVACGFGHTVVVLAGGECLTCGWNKAGQCGNGSNADVLTPVQVPKLKGHSIQHAAAGGGHTAVVTHAGVLFTFGSGSCGQLGLGSNLDSSEPSQVQGALKGEEVAAVACGEEFTVAITAERDVYVWGLNNVGQLGGAWQGEFADTPVHLEALRHSQVELCCSNQSQSVALTSTGLVLEWGQVGGGVDGGARGAMTTQQVRDILSGTVPGGGGAVGGGGGGSPPKELSGLSKRSVERIECGRRHFCVIMRGTHAPSCVASGKALCDAVAGRRELFKITALSAYGDPMTQGGDRFEALLFTENGDVVSDMQIDDGMDGTYEGQYTCAISGRCSLWLRLGGAHIQGSPFSILVAPQVASGEHSTLSPVCSLGPKILKRHLFHEAGESLTIWVYVRDKYSNACPVKCEDLVVSIWREPDDAAPVLLTHKVELDKSGTPLITCSPCTAGSYKITVSIKSEKGTQEMGAPVELTCHMTVMSAAADAKKSKVYGAGCEGAVVGQPAEFYVALFDRFENPAEIFRFGYNQEFSVPGDVALEIALHSVLPGGGVGHSVEASTVSCGFFYGAGYKKSTFSVGYTATKMGTLLLRLKVAGKDMMNMPLEIPVSAGATSALYSLVTGDGIEGGSLRNGSLTKTLSIEARDEYENKRMAGGDVFKVLLKMEGGGSVAAEVSDKGNGTYTASYSTTEADPAEEVRRRHHEQELLLQRQKEAAEERRLADARRRAVAEAREQERNDIKAAARQREAEERKTKAALDAQRSAAEAKEKEEEKRRKLMLRLRREEEARRRAVVEEEQKRQAVIDKMKQVDQRRCRPGSAIKRAGGGFVLSFSGDGSAKSAAPKDAWS